MKNKKEKTDLDNEESSGLMKIGRGVLGILAYVFRIPALLLGPIKDLSEGVIDVATDEEKPKKPKSRYRTWDN